MVIYTVKFESGAELSLNPLRIIVELSVVSVACDIYCLYTPAFVKGPVSDESVFGNIGNTKVCLLYTSPSPRDRTRSRMPSSA